MIGVLSLSAFLILVMLAAGRARILRKRGIKAFVFGATDKSDFLLMPVVAFFAYAILSTAVGLPFPAVLRNYLFRLTAVHWAGVVLCYATLIWFALTLKSFGDSFRIGIDENTRNKLVTNGTFSLSRNPLYLAFIVFLLGMLLTHPNLAACVALVLFAAAIHRQILREEKFLRNHYGQEYEEYCRQVRRYI